MSKIKCDMWSDKSTRSLPGLQTAAPMTVNQLQCLLSLNFLALWGSALRQSLTGPTLNWALRSALAVSTHLLTKCAWDISDLFSCFGFEEGCTVRSLNTLTWRYGCLFLCLIWAFVYRCVSAQSAKKLCAAPRLPDGYFVPEQATYTHETKLTYACEKGYKPAVEGWWATSTCQSGTWSPKPQCISKCFIHVSCLKVLWHI